MGQKGKSVRPGGSTGTGSQGSLKEFLMLPSDKRKDPEALALAPLET